MIRLLFALRVILDFVGSTGHSGKRTRLSPTRYTEGLSRVDPARESKPRMSKVNIRRTVENIRANTTVYSPIVEVVVNQVHR
jgi:hypothetical protein